MEYNSQNPIASGSQMPVQPEPPKSGVGPIAGAIVVILLLAAGGLYFYGAKLNEKNSNNVMPFIPSEEAIPSGGADSDTSSGLPPQSASDEAVEIQSDLEAMNFNEFESQTSTDVENFDSETQ
jgi:hypothetical protein